MAPQRRRWRGALAFVAGVGLLMGNPGQVRAQVAAASLPPLDTETALVVETVHASMFVSDPTFGKDPFFPGSQRRTTLPTPSQTQVVTNVPLETSSEELFRLLEIKGISFPSSGPLVLINKYTLAEGEERMFKLAGRAFPVRCVSIKDRSAVLSIRGRTKEFTLRDRL